MLRLVIVTRYDLLAENQQPSGFDCNVLECELSQQ